jgi:signal transduction histidine kinase
MGPLEKMLSTCRQNDQALAFCTDAAEIVLYFDPARLEEMIANLLANAVKFTPAGGKITLAVKVNNDGVKEGDSLEIFRLRYRTGNPRRAIDPYLQPVLPGRQYL